MTLKQAFANLQIDITAPLTKMAFMTLPERIKASEALYQEAKKRCKSLMAIYHPDRGGDAEKFKLVNSSMMVIESETKKFGLRLEEEMKERQKARESKVSIEFNGAK